MKHRVVCCIGLLFATACGSESSGPVRAARVDVTPGSLQLFPGDTARLVARATDASSQPLNDRAIGWSSSDPTVATVSANGLVTAVASGGPVTITATTDGVSGTASAVVRLTPVARIDLAASAAALEAGDTLRVSASLRAANGQLLTGRVISWSSSNTAAATISTAGLVTGVAPGTSTISASAEGVQTTLPLTVAAARVASLVLTPTSLSLINGTSQLLSASARDKSGNVLSGRTITWTSANPAIATVSAVGLVTAVGVGGPVSITATSEGVSGSVTLSVLPAPVSSISISLLGNALQIGMSAQAVATLRDANGAILSGRTVTWRSSSPSVASVSASGIVAALSVGTTTILATSETVTGTATVAVSAATLSTFRVRFDPYGLIVGDTLVPLWIAESATTGVRTSFVRFELVSGSAAVSIDSVTGRVIALAPGSALVRARVDGNTLDATIQVFPPPPVRFTFVWQGTNRPSARVQAAVEKGIRRWERVFVAPMHSAAIRHTVPANTCGNDQPLDIDTRDYVFLIRTGATVSSGASGGPCAAPNGSLPFAGVINYDDNEFAREVGLDSVSLWVVEAIAAHEAGHALGIGAFKTNVFTGQALVTPMPASPSEGVNFFLGSAALSAYKALGASPTSVAVPFAGGGFHWSTPPFSGEVMGSWSTRGFVRISSVSVGALADFGWPVSVLLADRYSLGLNAQGQGGDRP